MRGLIDLDVHAEVLLHDFLDVVARRLQHLQPAMIPIAHTREPGRTAAARPRFGTLALKVQLPVPVKPFALPDLLETDVVDVGKQVRGLERDVLAAQRDAAERIDV